MIPEKVYRYEDWDNENKGIRILTEKRIWLSAPSDFGADYLECRLPLNFETFDEETYEEFVRKSFHDEFPNLAPNELEQKIEDAIKHEPYDSLPFHNESHREEVLSIYGKKLDKTLGIFCTSKTFENVKMWEHGGNLGQGLCVALHTELLYKQTKLADGEADDIIYYPDDKTPMSDAISLSSSDRIIKVNLARFSVPQRFLHEEEFRFIRTNRLPYLNYPWEYAPYERIIPLPNEVYSEIILGPEISEVDKAEIIDTRNSNFENLPIWVLEYIEEDGITKVVKVDEV